MNWQVDVGFELASRRHSVISMYPRHVLQRPKDVFAPPWLAPAMRLHTCTPCTAVCHCWHHRQSAIAGTTGCMLRKAHRLSALQAVCHCQHCRLSATEGTTGQVYTSASVTSLRHSSWLQAEPEHCSSSFHKVSSN